MSESKGYSGNAFHTDFDLDTMIIYAGKDDYEELCYFPERIIVVKDMWVRTNGLDIVMPIRTSISHENFFYYKDIEPWLRQKIFSNPEAHSKLRAFLHRQNCIAHGNGFNVQNTELLARNYFSLVSLPLPFTQRLHTGTGSRDRSATNTYTDQEISSMSTINRVAHMLYLALSKMSKEVANLFTVQDLLMVAATLLALQLTPEGWALDTALAGMAFAYAGFNGVKSVSLLIKGVALAASANSNAEIEQAAAMTAKGAVHLGLDVIIAFLVHKQIGTAEGISATHSKTKVETKETANNDDYVKTDLGKKAEITPREIVEESFKPQGLSEAEARQFMNKNIVGQNMVNEFAKGNPNLDISQVKIKVMEALQSGSELPTENILKEGGFLYKLQPSEYSSVLPNTPYLITPEHYEQALQMAKQQGTTLDQVLGLPENNVRGDFSIWKMTTDKPATVFTNTIAPTQETVLQNGIEQVIQKPGGAVQDLLLNHNSFKQELMGTISNSPK